MTYFEDGIALTWSQVVKYLQYIRKFGINQFLLVFSKYKQYESDTFKYGDETEYIIVYAPKDNNKICKVSLRSCKVVSAANKNVNNYNVQKTLNTNDYQLGVFCMEYTHFQIESIPFKPFDCYKISDLLQIEKSMYCRRKWIESTLQKDEKLISMALFPILGLNKNSTYPSFKSGGNITKSKLISDFTINCHQKFSAETRGYRERRGKKVNISYPVESNNNLLYHELDATVFGNGNALQCTLQCKNMEECKYLYDQLNVLSYIMLSISAATPFIASKISKHDTRWNISVQAQDDRNHDEMKYVKSTRYGLNQTYLHKNGSKYNDIKFFYDEKCFQQLMNDDVFAKYGDISFAKHISRLFIRDTLFVYKSMIDAIEKYKKDPSKNANILNNSESYFQVFQSMNWNNVRFKPPPLHNIDNIGWRVEFRSMETQFSDFENAALTIFVVLLSRAILHFNIDLYLPISRLHENFEIAQNKNALLNEKFWYRDNRDNTSLTMKTINDIVNGKNGLLDIVNKYIEEVLVVDNKNDLNILKQYLLLIEKRCNGELLNNASYLRQFLQKHPLYKNDYNLNEQICRDIIDEIDKISHGTDDVMGNQQLLFPDNVNMNNRYYLKEVNHLNQYIEINKHELRDYNYCDQFDIDKRSKL